jgi:hypothetical protein
MKNESEETHAQRCSIVLAAGEGKRLQPFVSRWRGDLLFR